MKVKKILTLAVVSLFAVGLLVVSASAVNLDTTINDYGNIIDVSGYTLLTNITTSNVSFEYVSGYKIIVAEFSEVGDCYAVKRGTQTDTVYEVGSFGFSRFDDSSPYKFVCWEVGNPYSSYEIDGFDIYVKNYPFTVSNPTIWNQVGFVTYNIGNGTVDPDNPDDPDNPELPEETTPELPDNPEIPDIPEVTVPYGSALDWFVELMDERSNNRAFGTLLSYYNGFGDSRLFDVHTLVSGITDIRYSPDYSVRSFLGLSVIPDGEYASSQIHGQITIDAYAYSIFTSNGTPIYSDYGGMGFIQYSLYYESTGNTMVIISFYSQNSVTPVLSYLYEGAYTADGVLYTLKTISTPDKSYSTNELVKVDVSFAVSNGSTPYMLPMVCDLLYGRDNCNYDDVVYSPKQFYYGLNKAYNLGYADAYRYAYATGYDDGYVEGVKESYDVGYNDGIIANVNYEKAYTDGYNKAVSEIDSGEYGRNMLGGFFSAPISAIRDIVLVEWTTADGTTITINIMMIFSAIIGLSLFIWFLKMFAGG